MSILVIGSGGREHALVWRLRDEANRVFCAPGNAGPAEIATNVELDPNDKEAVIEA